MYRSRTDERVILAARDVLAKPASERCLRVRRWRRAEGDGVGSEEDVSGLGSEVAGDKEMGGGWDVMFGAAGY